MPSGDAIELVMRLRADQAKASVDTLTRSVKGLQVVLDPATGTVDTFATKQLQAATQADKATATMVRQAQMVRAMGQATMSATRSTSTMNTAMSLTARQLPDIATGFLAGGISIQYFAVQGLQVVQQMQAMGTSMTSLLRSFGPIGIALAALAAVWAVLAARLKTAEEAQARQAALASDVADLHRTLEHTLRDVEVATGDLTKAEKARLDANEQARRVFLPVQQQLLDTLKAQAEQMDRMSALAAGNLVGVFSGGFGAGLKTLGAAAIGGLTGKSVQADQAALQQSMDRTRTVLTNLDKGMDNHAQRLATLASGSRDAASATKDLADALSAIGLGGADVAGLKETLGAGKQTAGDRAEFAKQLIDLAPGTTFAGMSTGEAAVVARQWNEAWAASMDPPARKFGEIAGGVMAKAVAVAGKAASVVAGLASGDVSGMLAAAGPYGAAASALISTGSAGRDAAGSLADKRGLTGAAKRAFVDRHAASETAKSVRGQLMGVESSAEAIIKALPRILAHVIPRFAGEIVTKLIPALIKNAPAIYKALIIDMPIAIVEGIGKALLKLWDKIREWLKGVLAVGGKTGLASEQGLLGLKNVKILQHGSMSVERTGLALLHKGEQVVQAGGRAKQGSSGAGGGGTHVHFHTLTLDPNGAYRVVALLEQFLNPTTGRYRSAVLGTGD